MSSLRTVRQGIVELSLGQALVYRQTDRQTNRPTCAKQYTPLFSKGGIISIKPFDIYCISILFSDHIMTSTILDDVW